MRRLEKVVLVVCIGFIVVLSSIAIVAIFTSGPAKKAYEGPLVDCKCRFVRSGGYRSLRCYCPKLLEAEKSTGNPYKYGEKSKKDKGIEMTNYIEKEEWVKCVNAGFSCDHLVSTWTHKTKCGLRWRPGKVRPRHVWIPDAVWFSSHKKCKICFDKNS